MPDAPRNRTRVRLTAATVIMIAASLLATLVVRNVFVEAHRIIGWAVACAVVATLIGPVVGLMSRVMPRLVALILVGIGIAALAGLLTYRVFDDIDTETDRLREQGVAAAQELEARTDQLGDVARDLELTDRATEFFDGLDQRVQSGGDALRTAAGTAPTYFVCFILTIFIILYGGRLIEGGLGLVPEEERRDRLRGIVYTGGSNATRYVAASIAQGLVVAVLTLIVVTTLDLPAPALTTLLTATVAMVPYIGILLGSLPLALLAAGLSSPAAGFAVFVGAIVLQTVEAFAVRTRVDRRTLHVGPVVPIVVGLVAFEIYGIGAAFYGVVIAVFLLAFADAAASDDDEPIPLPTEDPSDSPDEDDAGDPDEAGGPGDEEQTAAGGHDDASAVAATDDGQRR